MKVVPQYVDIEDKIVGPLTWKQLGWFALGGAILVILYKSLDQTAFYTSAVPIVLLVTALAFYRPYGVTLASFIGYFFIFVFRPRTYVWQRDLKKIEKEKKENYEERKVVHEKKPVTLDEISIIAKTLDTKGVERNEKLEKILRERTDYQNLTKK